MINVDIESLRLVDKIRLDKSNKERPEESLKDSTNKSQNEEISNAVNHEDTLYELEKAISMGAALNGLIEDILRDCFSDEPLGYKHNRLIALSVAINDNLEVAKDLIEMSR